MSSALSKLGCEKSISPVLSPPNIAVLGSCIFSLAIRNLCSMSKRSSIRLRRRVKCFLNNLLWMTSPPAISQRNACQDSGYKGCALKETANESLLSLPTRIHTGDRRKKDSVPLTASNEEDRCPFPRHSHSDLFTDCHICGHAGAYLFNPNQQPSLSI